MIPQTTEEADFLARVAKALGRSQPQTEPPKREEVGPPVFWREMKLTDAEILEKFRENLEGLGGRVVIVNSPEEVQNQLRQWFQELNARTLLCWDHPELRQVANPESLKVQVHYCTVANVNNELTMLAEKVDVGLTWADYAIGYTGSLALFSAPNQGRTVSLLPPTHIAVFKRSNLVPTMSFVVNEIMRRNSANNLPGAISFITGPSRTSDIEMDLSIGVHGPYKVWVIILE